MKKILAALITGSLLMLLTVGSTSCTKPEAANEQEQGHEEDTPKDEDPQFSPDATISFTQDPKYSFGGEGGSVNIVFTCTGPWILEIPEELSWISSSATTGSGSTKRQSIKLTASENEEETQRSGKIILRAGENNTKTITLTQAEAILILTPADVPNLDKIYIPQEFRSFDMLRSDSKWFFGRSKQSEHFIVFWDIKYGARGTVTPTNAQNVAMRVDIDDLLKKAEEFYDLNVNKLKFAETGKGLSVLDKYKMEIFIIYQTQWLATGSGYDNTIGALWVNPSTCKPVGSTIGHEIGHCFQYMVFCDYLVREGKSGNAAVNASGNQGPGWRYGFAANGEGGNAFWEQTAQWQSYQIEKYRPEAFAGWYREYTGSTHLHVLHERPRYAAYFIHWWWVAQNDITFIGKLWNESVYPEDPVETYMRLMGYDVEQMNDSMYGYASHMVTFDTDEIRSYGKACHGQMAVPSTQISENDGWWNISAALSPETTGYNVIRMNAEAGEDIKVTLSGNLGISGCVSGIPGKAGWRYGFVSYNSDATRTYSPTWSETDSEKTWTVPENSSKVWFVVTGAPKEYERHPWTDESDNKDIKWPWKAKFENTKPYGK